MFFQFLHNKVWCLNNKLAHFSQALALLYKSWKSHFAYWWTEEWHFVWLEVFASSQYLCSGCCMLSWTVSIHSPCATMHYTGPIIPFELFILPSLSRDRALNFGSIHGLVDKFCWIMDGMDTAWTQTAFLFLFLNKHYEKHNKYNNLVDYTVNKNTNTIKPCFCKTKRTRELANKLHSEFQ